MRWLIVSILLAVAGCNCGTDSLSKVPQCANGTVTGIVCAPDLMTFVADATVTASGTCSRQTFTKTTTTDSMGHFSLEMPAGQWTLTASSGSFSRTYMIDVKPGQTTQIPTDQFCFKSNTTNLAVISGSGDHIETLLQQLGFTPTVIDGSPTGFDGPNGGLQFLKDPAQLAKYNVLFIDCAAGTTPVRQSNGKSYNELNFESDAPAIAQNLRQFVEKGGSLYASDWAFMYVYIAYQEEFHWRTASGSINWPFDPYTLMGFGPQTVNADVVDQALSGYLGKSTVSISFPQHVNHWGLMDMVNNPATTLISGAVQACSSSSCSSGSSASTEPLAGLYRVTNGPGGAVAYTSFHNIDQTSTDVEQILKYIIFKL